MKLLKRKVSAFLIAACLICMNIVPAFADTTAPDATLPAAADVKKEAQLTASYLMSNADFSDISASTSDFYKASHKLILAIRSGYDCSEQTAEYLESAKKIVKNDGTLNLPIYMDTKDIYGCHAYLLLVLALTGNDASDFNGVDVLSAFDKLMADITVDDLDYSTVYDDNWNILSSKGINPYLLGPVYTALDSYKASLKNYDHASSVITELLLKKIDSEDGFNYSGYYSVDTNGTVFPFFSDLYNSNSELKKKIDATVSYTSNNVLSSEYYVADYYNTSSANSDSTALALALYSHYGDKATAAAIYKSLISNCKSANNDGSYNTAYDRILASFDALTGAVTYEYALEGKSNPFDVSAEVKAIADAKNAPVEEPSTEISTETSTEQATEAATEFITESVTEPVTEASANPATSNDITTPQTGDVNVYMYMLLAAACAVTCGGITVSVKKSK